MSDPSDFTLNISRQDALAAPYFWEVIRRGSQVWVERSMHGYRTEQEASQAGQEALQRHINRAAATKPER
jgi:hypothetical protein